MKRLITILALTCALSGSTLAGDIPSGGSASPAPSDSDNNNSLAPGDIPTTGCADTINEDLLKGILGLVSFMTP
jgi:hypothetical protein